MRCDDLAHVERKGPVDSRFDDLLQISIGWDCGECSNQIKNRRFSAASCRESMPTIELVTEETVTDAQLTNCMLASRTADG